MFTLKRTLYPLLIPTVLILLSSATIVKWPDLERLINDIRELRAVMVIMPFVPYMVLVLGFAMGWRYASAGLILGTLTLAFSYYGLSYFLFPDLPRDVSAGQTATGAVAFLLPLNLSVGSVLIRRRPLTSAGILAALLLIVQLAAIFAFCHPQGYLSLLAKAKLGSLSPAAADKLVDFSRRLSYVLSDHSVFKLNQIPTVAVVTFGLSLTFTLIHFVKSGDIRIGGFFFAIIAALLGITAGHPEPAVIFYFIAAGLILLVSTIEASFSMAYIDELTRLPGRRSLNETLLNLGKRYTIAMVDVDRFKKFNDTYGHKTGDQVLKMIAGRLGKISGGAKTFRYGGEEFTAIFAGKLVEEAFPHVEDFRKAVESTPFIVRGMERRRNSARSRGKKSGFTRKQVKVTVSIGLAASEGQTTTPQKVIKAADKKLYQAKRGGRNRTVC
ncbi:MAG: GGDEF domain-containing protein [Desulfobacterales bacterium]|nr:MAG: GGDEF domain-containing protein [Desulfobacterales bacterium]